MPDPDTPQQTTPPMIQDTGAVVQPDAVQSSEPAPAPQAAAPQTVTPPVTQPTQQVAVAPAVQGKTAPHHSMLGNVYERVLSGMSGGRTEQVPYIDRDPNSKTYGQTFTRTVDRTPGSQWRSIIASMLTGLAAGSQVPPQKSAAAAAAAGLGEGFVAARQQRVQQQERERQHMGEEFEREQKALLQKHEIAKGNVEMYRALSEARKFDLEQDPTRQAGIAIYNEAQKAGIPGVQSIPASELQQRIKADPHFATDNVILPMGFGQPTPGENGEMKPGEGMVAIIPGKEGKIQLPAEYADLVKKYAPFSGRADLVQQLQSGQGIDVRQLPALNAVLAEGLNRWQQGEMAPKLAVRMDAKGNPIITSVNPLTGERPSWLPAGEETGEAATLTANLNEKEMRALQEQNRAILEQSQGVLAQAQAAQQKAELTLMGLTGGTPESKTNAVANYTKQYNLTPKAQALLSQYSPTVMNDIVGLWDHTIDPRAFVVTLRKGTGQMPMPWYEAQVKNLDLAQEGRVTWSQGDFNLVQKFRQDMTDGKKGQQIDAYNNFLGHAAELQAAANDFNASYPEAAGKSINWLKKNFGNDPKLQTLMVAVKGPLREWETIMSTGHVPSSEEKQGDEDLANENLPLERNIAGAKAMAGQMLVRMRNTNQDAVRLMKQPWPNILTPDGQRAAQQLGLTNLTQGLQTGGYSTGGAGGTQNPTQVQGLSYLRTVDGTNRQIGWDGTKYVYTDTREPYQAAPQAPAQPAPQQPAAQPSAFPAVMPRPQGQP